MYMRIIIGSSLVSIFFLNFASDATRSSLDIAATSERNGQPRAVPGRSYRIVDVVSPRLVNIVLGLHVKGGECGVAMCYKSPVRKQEIPQTVATEARTIRAPWHQEKSYAKLALSAIHEPGAGQSPHHRGLSVKEVVLQITPDVQLRLLRQDGPASETSACCIPIGAEVSEVGA